MTWTLTNAAGEFGVTRETLRKRITLAELPQKTHYTTKEICRAIYSDIANERTRLVREQADKVALENQSSRKELVPPSELLPKLGKFLESAKARIEGDPKLDRCEKDKIIEDLGKLLDVALNCASVPAGDTNATAALHSEPVGRAV